MHSGLRKMIRVTKVGKFIEEPGDELPQLLMF